MHYQNQVKTMITFLYCSTGHRFVAQNPYYYCNGFCACSPTCLDKLTPSMKCACYQIDPTFVINDLVHENSGAQNIYNPDLPLWTQIRLSQFYETKIWVGIDFYVLRMSPDGNSILVKNKEHRKLTDYRRLEEEFKAKF